MSGPDALRTAGADHRAALKIEADVSAVLVKIDLERTKSERVVAKIKSDITADGIADLLGGKPAVEPDPARGRNLKKHLATIASVDAARPGVLAEIAAAATAVRAAESHLAAVRLASLCEGQEAVRDRFTGELTSLLPVLAALSAHGRAIGDQLAAGVPIHAADGVLIRPWRGDVLVQRLLDAIADRLRPAGFTKAVETETAAALADLNSTLNKTI